MQFSLAELEAIIWKKRKELTFSAYDLRIAQAMIDYYKKENIAWLIQRLKVREGKK